MSKLEIFLRFLLFVVVMALVAYIVSLFEWGYDVLTADPLEENKTKINEKVRIVKNTVESIGENTVESTVESPGENTDLYIIHNERIFDKYNNYLKRGVYYDTLNTINAPSFYYISMGEKNTGGYRIEITDVLIEENNCFTVIVKESNPPRNAVVTMAFDTPVCMIEFKTLPNDIKFINQYGEVLKHINF